MDIFKILKRFIINTEQNISDSLLILKSSEFAMLFFVFQQTTLYCQIITNTSAI